MLLKFFIASILLFAQCFTQLLTEVNLLNGAVNTGVNMWAYIIGISIELDNIRDHLNNSLFQAYQLNALLNADYLNAWTIDIKAPKGHKFMCDKLKKNNTLTNIDCTFDSFEN
jgi:hypothetical protein